MGIETAALAAVAPEIIGGTAAATAATAGTAAAGLTATEAVGAGLTAAEVAGSGIAAGSLEAANMVGAIGGDALGAFISANQGFGTMTAMESMAGLAGAINQSPIVQGITKAGEAGQGGEQQAQRPAPNVGPETSRPNQNPGLTQSSSLMQSAQQASNPASLGVLGFADGGQVPSNILQQLLADNIFSRTRDRREQEAGLQQPQQPASGVTINIGNSGDQKQDGSIPRSTAETPSVSDFASSVLKLIKGATGYEDGTTAVRTGSSDVRAGGEIRGPESKSGRDNQIIKVAGGEGILPKDVMDVPGVADLVQNLIKTFHTPVKG